MKTYKGRPVIAHADNEGQWYARGYLPHLDGAETQHVCFRLFDSLPQHVLDEWRVELESLPPKEADLEQRKRLDAFLDSGYGSCYLRDERVAAAVQNALLFFDGARYTLHAWCVMPNHVHTLFSPLAEWRMSKITHSWKSFTASQCNKILGRSGTFWEKESFDRYIRNEQHFQNAVKYIENNPVKAGLCQQPADWRWSSAYQREA